MNIDIEKLHKNNYKSTWKPPLKWRLLMFIQELIIDFNIVLDESFKEDRTPKQAHRWRADFYILPLFKKIKMYYSFKNTPRLGILIK